MSAGTRAPGNTGAGLSKGEVRLLYRLLAEEHDASEQAVKEADERLERARSAWESKHDAP